MEKIFGVEKYNFYISNVKTSIIYNNENVKDKIINELIKQNFLVINTKMLNFNITVKDFLNAAKFDMKLIPYYGIKDLLSDKFINLTFENQVFIKIIASICNSKEIVVFDDVLTFLNPDKKYLVLKYLKENDITYINFTSDMEEVLYTKYLIVLSSSGVIIEGNTKSVLKEEKIIKHNGFNLPFVVDLSTQLKDYGILDKEYYSIDKLVSDLWK